MDIEQFRETGRLVEHAWRNVAYQEDLLPVIAERALVETEFCDLLNFDEVLRWVQERDQEVHDADRDQFGDLPLIVYHGRHFFVQLLVWSRGMTDIHQHAFSGAFKVLQGSSIQSVYDVKIEAEVSDTVLLANSCLSRVELLARGDVRPIRPGWGLTHATFHLEAPTVTLLIRSTGSRSSGPLHMLASPRLAFSPEAIRRDGPTRSVAQTLRVAHRIGHPDFAGIARRCLSSLEFPHVLDVLYLIQGLPIDRDSICDELAARHGELADYLPEFLDALERQATVRRMSRTVDNGDDWFLVVMLLLSQGRSDVDSLISNRFGRQQPAHLYQDLVDRMPWVASIPIRELWRRSELATANGVSADQTACSRFDDGKW